MLTPEYLEACCDDVLGLYDALNESIVRDISRRIVKTGKVTDSARWQLKQVQESGKLMEEIIQEVASVTKFSDSYISELFNESGVISLKYEGDICSAAGLTPISLKQSPAMMQTLAAAVEKTQGNINNLTMTTAVASQNLYLQYTNLAYMQVTSGAFSYQEAIKQAVKAAAVDGGKVLYQKGHSSKLDVAVRRSLLTGVNQTAGKLTEMYADEMECDYFETTAHLGARNTGTGYNNHESWQGQVFCISGKDKRYRQFRETTGYGEGGGLCGWNCRHNFHMFFLGLSKPAYSREILEGYAKKTHQYKDADGNTQTLTEYECTQMQRAYERQIRESKSLLAGYDSGIKAAPDEKTENALREEFNKESARLKKREAEMKDFCKQTNRAVDSARTQVHAVKDSNGKIVNFNKSVSQKAVWANKKTGSTYSIPSYTPKPQKTLTTPKEQAPVKKTPDEIFANGKIGTDAYKMAMSSMASGGYSVEAERIVEMVDSVFEYTAADYTNILAAQTGFKGRFSNYSSILSDEEKSKAIQDAANVAEFLRKSPKYKGTVYRGVGFDVGGPYDSGQYEQFRELYTKGNVVETDTFTSWTKKESYLNDIFSARTGLDDELEYMVEVKMEIKNSAFGVDISNYSELKAQDEVLFNKSSTLYVRNVREEWVDDELLRLFIELEEL